MAIPFLAPILASSGVSKALSALNLLAKVAPWISTGILLAALMVTRSDRDEQKRIVTEFRTIVTEETVPAKPGETVKPLSVPEAQAALRGMARDRREARASLERITRQTRQRAQRAAQDDIQLTVRQAENNRDFRQAKVTIDKLKQTKSTGDPDKDDALIDQMTAEPWKGW